MLSLACPICLQDMTDSALERFATDVTQVMVRFWICTCQCRRFAVVVNHGSTVASDGLYVEFQDVHDASNDFVFRVSLIDGIAMVLSMMAPNPVFRIISGTDRSQAWERAYRQALASEIMSC